ncbi:MAG: glycoside hydrolase family 1 protein, partial [Myxococcales bacterium]|nr:glycoside hydrolase family 1 protein [Myxococcales bacterium]
MRHRHHVLVTIAFGISLAFGGAARAGTGDVSGNGIVNVGDAVLALDTARKGSGPDPAADVLPAFYGLADDGVVGNPDLQALTEAAIGRFSPFSPRTFLLGAATAAYQIEGNNTTADWALWEDILAARDPGYVKSGAAADHYNRYAEDFDYVQSLGLPAHRLSLEWSRIEPERDVIDQDALQHYRDVITALADRGITPILTLQHFTLPQWVLDPRVDGDNVPFPSLGGWASRETIDEFVEFVQLIACDPVFASRVDYWIPINEPVVLTILGYLVPLFPPSFPGRTLQQGFADMFEPLRNLAYAHAAAYDAIKACDTVDADGDGVAALVGVAKSANLYEGATEPGDPDYARDQAAANIYDYFWVHQWLNMVVYGVVDYNLSRVIGDDAEDRAYDPALAGHLDFLGINYYNRQVVSWDDEFFFNTSNQILAGFPVTDPAATRHTLEGAEVYPEGLRTRLTSLHRRYHLPMMVTESGIITHSHHERAVYLLDHFKEIQKAIALDGTPVLGFTYWTLLDTFEWHLGWKPGYGLVTINERTLARVPGQAAELLGRIATDRGVDQALEDEFRPVPPDPDFLWGAATSAIQVEGGNTVTDFYKMYDVLGGGVLGHDCCRIEQAGGHYTHFVEDFDLLQGLGINAFRLAIDWGRIEPQQGVFDQAEVDHYHAVLQALRARGMTPVVTLHHFANPTWVLDPEFPDTDLDGFLNDATIDAFVDFVSFVAAEYGDEVDWWSTLNEPFFYPAGGYVFGTYPPGETGNTDALLTVHAKLAFAHQRAYDAIKAADTVDADGDGKASLVGVVEGVNIYEPADPNNPLDVQANEDLDYLFNWSFLDYLRTGMLDVNVDGDADDGASTVPPEGYYPELQGKLDYIGVNNFLRRQTVYNPDGEPNPPGATCLGIKNLCFRDVPNLCEWDRNFIGFENSGPGLLETVAELHTRYGLPILFTENGALWGVGPDRERIGSRQTEVYLDYLQRARNQGYPVVGYMSWSAIDGWEVLGIQPGTGLLSVDFESATLDRSV